MTNKQSSPAVLLLPETQVWDPLEDHRKHWWKQLHLCWPHPAAIQSEVGVSPRQTPPRYETLGFNQGAFTMIAVLRFCIVMWSIRWQWERRTPFLTRRKFKQNQAHAHFNLQTEDLTPQPSSLRLLLHVLDFLSFRSHPGLWGFREGCWGHGVWFGNWQQDHQSRCQDA